MNRPLTSLTRRNRRLIVRLTDDERVRLQANAKSAGLRISEYVRRAALDGKVVVQRHSGYGDYLADQLRRVGVNINQIARVANTDGEVPAELASVCRQLEKILDRIIRKD